MTEQHQKDYARLRELGKKYAEIANRDENLKLIENYKNLNNLKAARPLIKAEEVPWHEMNVNDELTSQISDPFLKEFETLLLRAIYQNKHMSGDSVYQPWLVTQRAVKISSFGLDVDEETLSIDDQNAVVSHSYKNLINSTEDAMKITKPTITEDVAETNRRFEIASEIFDGILDVRSERPTIYAALWDDIAMWMGVENLLMALITEPDLMHLVIDRYSSAMAEHLKDLEKMDMLYFGTTVHTSYNYLPEMQAGPQSLDKVWLHSAAQIFGSTSKEMHKEFEFDYIGRLYELVGYGHYGCCEPLHGRLDLVRAIPNIRKISCSPWCDMQIAADEIRGDYAVSFKPNPSYLAGTSVNWEVVEDEVSRAFESCRKNNTPMEIILKDISTVNYKPERLWEWVSRVSAIVGK